MSSPQETPTRTQRSERRSRAFAHVPVAVASIAVAVAALAACTTAGPPATTISSTTTSSTTSVPPPTAGPVSSWGYNGFGNLGNGTLADQPTPVTFNSPPQVAFRSVSAGAFHSLALATDGTAYAVGRDDTGQLGNDAALAYQVTPVAVAAPAGVHFTAVSAGGFHSLAIGDDGATYAWGKDAEGQLGNGAPLTTEATPVRVAVPAGVRFTAVSAGYAHSLAIGSDGRAYSWGFDAFGELGNGTFGVNTSVPAPVSLPTGVTAVAVAAGGHHNMVIGNNGVTYAWGWDAYGQLGDDAATTDQAAPVPVSLPVGVRFTSIATGDHHSLAIGTDGRTYAWGKDQQGQLGDGAPLADQPTPVAVAVPAGIRFTQVAGGGDFSLAVGTDGRAYSWGDDSSGSLGDDAALTNQPTPTNPATPAGRRVLAVSAGYYHGLALLAP